MTLRKRSRTQSSRPLQPCIDAATLPRLQQEVGTIHVSDALLNYLQALLGKR